MGRRRVVLVSLFIIVLTVSLSTPLLEVEAQSQPLCWFKTIRVAISDVAVFQDGIYFAGTKGVGRLDLDATHRWFLEFDIDWGSRRVESIAVSQNGVYIAGHIEDDYYTSLVAKFDFDGNLQWFKVIRKVNVDIEAYSMAITQDGSGQDIIYIVGEYYDGRRKYFVAKLDGDGNLKWFKCTSKPFYSTLTVAIGSDGIYVAGNVYLAKFDMNGNVQWIKSISSITAISGVAVAQDGSGQDVVYLTGHLPGSHPFLAKFDTNGNLQLFRELEFFSNGRCSVVARQDGAYITGPFRVRLFNDDVFIARFDANGNLQRFKLFGGSDSETVESIAVLQDYVFTGGTTQTYWGGNFLAKLDLTFTGNLYWTGGINWPPVNVRDHEPTVAQLTPAVTPETLSLSDATVSVSEESQLTLNYYVPGQWLAVSGQLPVADFTWTPTIPRVGEAVQFDASASYDPDGQIVQYQWDFGDGTQLSTDQPVVQHTFQDSGTYSVTLTVIDDFGLSDSVTKQVTVTWPPVADFTWSPTNPLVGEAVQFTPWAYDPDGWIVQARWDFGDGTGAYGWAIQHVFTAPGTYRVTFTVTDNLGATTVVAHDVTVQEPINPYMLTLGTRRLETLAGLACSTFDGTPVAYLAGTTDRRTPFLAMLSLIDGQPIFSRIYQPFRRAYVDGINVVDGSVYVSSHYRNAFLAKFDQAGQPTWLLELGSGKMTTRINDIERGMWGDLEEGAGVIYVAGQWEGTRRETRGMPFLACIGEDGQVNWIKGLAMRLGGTAKVVILAEGGLYVVGTTYEKGRGDAFVAKFSLDGALLDYATFGGRRAEAVEGALFYNDHLYILGNTKSFGRDKTFVAKFDPVTMQLEAFTTLDIGRYEHSFSIAQENLLIVGSSNRDRLSFVVELDPDTLAAAAGAMTGPRFISARAVERVGNALLVAGQTSIGEGRLDAFLAYLPDGFTGTINWPEGWQVSYFDINIRQEFHNLQTFHMTPRTVNLHGYLLRNFGVQDWNAAIHMSETGE